MVQITFTFTFVDRGVVISAFNGKLKALQLEGFVGENELCSCDEYNQCLSPLLTALYSFVSFIHSSSTYQYFAMSINKSVANSCRSASCRVTYFSHDRTLPYHVSAIHALLRRLYVWLFKF